MTRCFRAVLLPALACVFVSAQAQRGGAPAAPPAQAPTPPVAGGPAVTFSPALAPGTVLTYAMTVQVQISRTGGGLGDTATLNNDAGVEMTVLGGGAVPVSPGPPGSMDVQLRFTRDRTTVTAAPDLQASLQQQTAATDHAALTMDPVTFRLGPGDDFQVLSRSNGDDYDQPVVMLGEIARNDSLPPGAVRVGDHWSRSHGQEVPTLKMSVPMQLECALAAIDGQGTGERATLVVHTTGSAPLPASVIPQYGDMMAAGEVPTASIDFSGDSTSVYSVPDAVLQSSSSKTRETLHFLITLAGGQTQTSDTVFNSTGTVRLVSTGHRP